MLGGAPLSFAGRPSRADPPREVEEKLVGRIGITVPLCGRPCRRGALSAVRRSFHAAQPTTQTSRPEGGSSEKTGGDLLSRALAGQVPSALRGLTSLFGMGRGVSPSP